MAWSSTVTPELIEVLVAVSPSAMPAASEPSILSRMPTAEALVPALMLLAFCSAMAVVIHFSLPAKSTRDRVARLVHSSPVYSSGASVAIRSCRMA